MADLVLYPNLCWSPTFPLGARRMSGGLRLKSGGGFASSGFRRGLPLSVHCGRAFFSRPDGGLSCKQKRHRALRPVAFLNCPRGRIRRTRIYVGKPHDPQESRRFLRINLYLPGDPYFVKGEFMIFLNIFWREGWILPFDARICPGRSTSMGPPE